MLMISIVILWSCGLVVSLIVNIAGGYYKNQTTKQQNKVNITRNPPLGDSAMGKPDRSRSRDSGCRQSMDSCRERSAAAGGFRCAALMSYSSYL